MSIKWKTNEEISVRIKKIEKRHSSKDDIKIARNQQSGKEPKQKNDNYSTKPVFSHF